ncbi:S8 family serine peptidase [Sungkyunkwania multivorans]|uniref:S8 family serine peptidase n=1 Tax=Sungkyunkwania multivorans TaxID=1173618 RepID=A0ABW3CZA0_9FLAO
MRLTTKALLLMAAVVVVSCSREEQNSAQEELLSNELIETPKDPLTPQEINREITQTIESSGTFSWSDASDHLLWSAVIHGDNVLTIGFGAKGESYRTLGQKDVAGYKQAMISAASEIENSGKKQTEKILINENEVLNVFDIKVEKIATIQALRKMEGLRYIEASGYRYVDIERQTASGSGCDTSGATLDSQDYRTIAPNARVPWTFDQHNITQAWDYSTGSGIGIAVIDTGLSSNQPLLNSSGINDGYSTGRTVKKFGVYVDSWWPWSNNTDGPNDKCGHGTSMSAAAAAPRNDDNLPVGVAYNANLISYRATSDVVLDGYQEQRGVARALREAGDRSDVKIISMSIGYPFSIGRIKDAVRYAYGKGKLIFAAGGTSTSFTSFVGVIFPANMSEAIAVTGIRDDGYNTCDICHDGSKIEFTVVMERRNTGKKMPVLGFNSGQNDYVGGSSVATATTAGIAALVWAKNPGWSRSQVLNKLRQSADFYPNKDSDHGYGNIDALKAVQ